MLDNLSKIHELDKGNILSSIEHLSDQIQAAWDDVGKLDLSSYNSCENIVVAGMGGSALGGRIVHYLEFKNLRAPIEVVTGYHLPGYVNSTSLVILSSYSGNTEETLSCAHEALAKNAKMVGIATGGKLLKLLEDEHLPHYKIDPVTNPSGQPRMGLGYSITAILRILSLVSFIMFDDEDVKSCIASTDKFVAEFGIRVPSPKNIAKHLAQNLSSKIPVLISSEHLVGSAHAMKNQINENAKTVSLHVEISEMNHHLLDGLKFPSKAREILEFLLIESANYYERNTKRYLITKEIIEKSGYKVATYKTQAKNKHDEIFEILVLGSYVSFYLAMLHGINPTPIPWVDYLKEKML